MGIDKSKLLFLVTEDWYFMSHRCSLAMTAIESGFDVHLLTQPSRFADEINDSGVHLTPTTFPRSFKRPWQDVITLTNIFKAYRNIKPDIIHHVSLKPILYGSLIQSLLIRKRHRQPVINAFTGLGYVFTSDELKAKIIRSILIPILKIVLSGEQHCLLFQNEDDKQTMINLGIASEENTFLIPGSGVDTQQYGMREEEEAVPVCMFVGRMLHDKGVDNFIEAARILKEKSIEARFVLVGESDSENPAAINVDRLGQLENEGIIECWGKCDNMPDVYSKSHIVVLPSWREGFPKVLIEAAACGRSVITTDVPGCRDAVIHENTGLIVPLKAPDTLAAAMKSLIEDKQKRQTMGKAGHQLVLEKFSTDVINTQFIQLYHRLLK